MTASAPTTNEGNHYARTMTVTEINTEKDLVTLTDTTDHTWEFEGIEDWVVGDIASCIMDSKGTEEIKDDAIVDIKYNGYIGDKFAVSKAIGTFESGYKDLDGNVYYQFKSYDDAVWWAITAEEIGFEPKENTEYTLIYYNNGTTDCTECPEEFDCECEVYDDVFIAVLEGRN